MVCPRAEIHAENRRLRLIERERLKALGAREVGDVSDVLLPSDLQELLAVAAGRDGWAVPVGGVDALTQVGGAMAGEWLVVVMGGV